jgi:multisubunit Na+/H+ antiporter MnhB subunit
LQPRDTAENTGGKRAPVIFTLAIAAFLAVALIDALSVSVMIDKVFPVTVAGLSLIGALILLVQMRRSPESSALFADGEHTGEDASAPIGLWPTLFWFISLLVLTALFGFVIALGIFFVAFLKLRGRENWSRTAILTAAGVGFVLVMAYLLNRDFPPGLLQEFVELPWPFGGI